MTEKTKKFNIIKKHLAYRTVLFCWKNFGDKMRDNNFIKIIENEFQKYYEKTIGEMRENHPQFGNLTNAAVIRMQDDYLTSEIKCRNVNFKLDKLSAYQRAEYNKALIQQLFYVLTEGDFRMMSGFDVTNNSFTQKSDLEKRYMSPSAKQTLTAAGLFYSALNGGGFCRYPHRGY